MKRAALILVCLALLVGVLSQIGPRHPHAPPGGLGPRGVGMGAAGIDGKGIMDWAEDFPDIEPFGGFDVLPLDEALARVQTRFHGKLIAARLVAPRPSEQARGVELVHEMRLLTARRDVLIIRLDARTGDFLEIAGAGLTQARRMPEGHK